MTSYLSGWESHPDFGDGKITFRKHRQRVLRPHMTLDAKLITIVHYF